MTNLCTKVTVRKRPIRNGQISLYLDFYPAIRNPKNGQLTRREYLGIYIYANPTEPFQEEFNRSMMQKAELIKCRRVESIICEEFGFLDKSKTRMSFLDYLQEKTNDRKESKLNSCYSHFRAYCKGSCRFSDLSVPFVQGFLTYLLSDKCMVNGRHLMASTANNLMNRLKPIIRMAHEDGYIKQDFGKKVVLAKENSPHREYLTYDELMMLVNTPCKIDVLKRASLFSCLTGLRISDILNLRWENIQLSSDGGWVMHIVTQKTKTDAVLPLSEETLSLCGERGEGKVFAGLSPYHLHSHLKDWVKSAGIEKHITFHCFRHTFATLQIAAGTDLYVVSKMLTHSDIGTTQIYAQVVNEQKRKASERISIRPKF